MVRISSVKAESFYLTGCMLEFQMININEVYEMNNIIIDIQKMMGGGKSPLLIADRTLPLFQSGYIKVVANQKVVA